MLSLTLSLRNGLIMLNKTLKSLVKENENDTLNTDEDTLDDV